MKSRGEEIKREAYLIRVAYDLLPGAVPLSWSDIRHCIPKLRHGLTASNAVIRATTVYTEAAGQGHCREGTEDGDVGEMHDSFVKIWDKVFVLGVAWVDCCLLLGLIVAWIMRNDAVTLGEETSFMYM